MKIPFAVGKKQQKVTPVQLDENGEEIPEPETFDTGEQTHFAEELPILVEGDFSDPTVVREPQKPNRLKLAAMIGVPVLFLLFLLMVLLRPRGTVHVAPTPSPLSDIPAETRGEIGRRLDLVDQDIQEADPFQPELAFPPVSFELNLEDATLLQARTQRRR